MCDMSVVFKMGKLFNTVLLPKILIIKTFLWQMIDSKLCGQLFLPEPVMSTYLDQIYYVVKLYQNITLTRQTVFEGAGIERTVR